MWCEAAKASSFRRPSTQWSHVGFDPGLVDKDQALWIKPGLPGSPTASAAGHINAALFTRPGLPPQRLRTLFSVIRDLRREAGDFA